MILTPVQITMTVNGNNRAAPPTAATHQALTGNPPNQFMAIYKNGRGGRGGRQGGV